MACLPTNPPCPTPPLPCSNVEALKHDLVHLSGWGPLFIAVWSLGKWVDGWVSAVAVEHAARAGVSQPPMVCVATAKAVPPA